MAVVRFQVGHTRDAGSKATADRLYHLIYDLLENGIEWAFSDAALKSATPVAGFVQTIKMLETWGGQTTFWVDFGGNDDLAVWFKLKHG